MKRFSGFIMFITIFLFVSQMFAASEIRFVNSQKINEKYPEAIALQKKLQEIYQEYENEYKEMVQTLQQKQQDLENQSLLLSPEKKAQRQQELQQMYTQLEQYKVEKLGPQGEMYQKNQKLMEPLLKKIQDVIDRIAKDEKYDMVIDSATQGLIFYNEKLDITDRILEELQKSK